MKLRLLLSFREFASVFKDTGEETLEEYLTYGGMPKLVDLVDDARNGI